MRNWHFQTYFDTMWWVKIAKSNYQNATIKSRSNFCIGSCGHWPFDVLKIRQFVFSAFLPAGAVAAARSCFGLALFIKYQNLSREMFPFNRKKRHRWTATWFTRVRVVQTGIVHYRPNLIGKLTPRAMQKVFHLRKGFLGQFVVARRRERIAAMCHD